MSEAAMLAEATARLFDEHLDEAAIRAGRDGWLGEAWDAIEAMGLPLALVPEERGGYGIATADAFALVRLAGARATPLPLGETMAANAVLAAAGLPLAEGPAALVTLSEGGRFANGRITGTAKRIAWGRNARTLVVETGEGIARLTGGWRVVAEGRNLAGHPRDTITIDAAAAEAAPLAGPSLIVRGGAVRALQVAGALGTALSLTVDHVNERVQFGRALAKFQAIQHEAARAAGEVACAAAAAGLAAEALDRPAPQALLAVAAARVRGGEAVGVVASIAHQLHGAIGFAAEHRLHLSTTCLWSWRDEFGAQPWWTRTLGEAALAAGGDGFWPFVTAA